MREIPESKNYSSLRSLLFLCGHARYARKLWPLLRFYIDWFASLTIPPTAAYARLPAYPASMESQWKLNELSFAFLEKIISYFIDIPNRAIVAELSNE